MPGRTTRPSLFAYAIALLIALQTATPAWAWGRLGHRVISRLAKKHMTEKARDALADLLDDNETIADASTWADENRRRLPKTAPWHYVDVPLDEPRYDSKWSADDPKKGCLVDKINEFRKVVKDKSKSVEERRRALRFLIHFIEDMHQPCHVGDNHDRGGNDTQVRFFDRGTNIHSLWDGGLHARVSNEEDYGLKELTVLPSSPILLTRPPGRSRIAMESLLAAREAYVDPATGQRIKSGAKLGLDYHNKNLPVVKERMHRAALRLARVLNECFE
jgi:nuclease S1